MRHVEFDQQPVRTSSEAVSDFRSRLRCNHCRHPRVSDEKHTNEIRLGKLVKFFVAIKLRGNV